MKKSLATGFCGFPSVLGTPGRRGSCRHLWPSLWQLSESHARSQRKRGIVSASPDKGGMVCLGLRSSLNFWLQRCTLPCLYGFFFSSPSVYCQRFVHTTSGYRSNPRFDKSVSLCLCFLGMSPTKVFRVCAQLRVCVCARVGSSFLTRDQTLVHVCLCVWMLLRAVASGDIR